MAWPFVSARPFHPQPDGATSSAEVEVDSDDAPEIEEAPEPAKPRDTRRALQTAQDKVCRMCGTDLKGHRRYKDSRGYLCKDCNKLDQVARLPCADCGKPTLPEGLRPWGTESLCARCYAEREADPSAKRMKKVSHAKFELHEKQGVIAVAAVLGFLMLLIVLNKLGCIGG